MEDVKKYNDQVMEDLKSLLRHTEIFKPVAEFELYESTLNLFLIKSDFNEKMNFFVEAMHEIYCKKAKSNLNWIDDLETLTYDLYKEMMNE